MNKFPQHLSNEEGQKIMKELLKAMLDRFLEDLEDYKGTETVIDFLNESLAKGFRIGEGMVLDLDEETESFLVESKFGKIAILHQEKGFSFEDSTRNLPHGTRISTILSGLN